MQHQPACLPIRLLFVNYLHAGVSLSLALIALAWNQPTFADEQTPWTLVGGNLDSHLVYIDKSRTLKKGYKLQVWTLFNYAKFQQHPNGKLWQSLVVHEEIDCAERSSRSLATYLYEAMYGKGQVIDLSTDPDKGASIHPPESAGDRVIQFACKAAKEGGQARGAKR
jgi:hypothetical protein